jgi:rhamnosyl/mannosyltransferase
VNIVELGKYYSPHFGGVELVTELSAKALAEQHSVDVICFNDGPGESREVCDGVPVTRLRTEATILHQGISFGLLRRLKALQPDLVHFHAPNYWAAAILLFGLPKTPLLITHHCDVEGRAPFRQMLRPIYSALARRALAVIVTSKKNAENSHDLPRSARVVVIPLGVDDREFEPDPTAPAGGEHPVTIGFVGRLVWYKGLGVLLEALTRLPAHARLLVIGDGPLRAQLEQRAQEFGLASRVTFAGTVSNDKKIELLRSIDILAFPSTHPTESFGLAQVEAQLLEKPVVCTDLPTGASEVVIDGETGFIVPPGNSAALAEAMERLLDDPALRAHLGRKGRERCLAHFTRGQYAASLRALVSDLERECVRRRRPRSGAQVRGPARASPAG